MKGTKLLSMLLVVFALVPGCKGGEEASAPAAVSKGMVTLVGEYMQASNARDSERLKSFYAESVVTEYVDHVPATHIRGRDALVDGTFQESWKAIPDTRFEPLRVLIRGREIVVISLATGTNTGPIGGMPATNKPIGILSAYHWTLDESGKISSEVVYMDQLTLPGQLGLLDGGLFRSPADVGSSQLKLMVPTDDEAERGNVEVIKKQLEAFNRRDAAAVAELYTSTAAYSFMPDPEDYRGIKAISAWLGEQLKMSTDIKGTHEWIWGADDYVAARTVVRGTNDGELPGGDEPTGKTFQRTQLDVYKLTKGKITRHWTFASGMAIDVQLGLAEAAD